MYDTAITFRTNSTTKKQAQKLFSSLGLDMSTAINIFLKQSVREKSIPFEVSIREKPNAETMAAIRESYEHPENFEGPFDTVEELMESLNA